MTKYESMLDCHGESWSYVPETRFGQWFLRTNIWTVHVLKRAINDLDRIWKIDSPRIRSLLTSVVAGGAHSACLRKSSTHRK